MADFFISYTHNDADWAEWIGYALEEAGFTVILQAWDFGRAATLFSRCSAPLLKRIAPFRFCHRTTSSRISQPPSGPLHSLRTLEG